MSKRISFSLLLLFLGVQIGYNTKAQAQTQIIIPTQPQVIPPTTPSTTNAVCASQLNSVVEGVTNRPMFGRTHWGILVQNQGSPQTLYSQNAQKFFTPASNGKLLTTAAALQALGADYRFRTSVYNDGNGVLRVVGRGDPSLKNEQLTVLAKQLRLKGIRQVNQLIADDSYFRGETVDHSWMWEDIQFYYGAPVNSLILNENATVLRLFPQSPGKPLLLKWDDPTEASRWQVVNKTVTLAKNQQGYVGISRDLKGPILTLQGNLAADSKPDVTAIAVFDPVESFLRHFRQSLTTEGITVKTMFTGTRNSGQEIASVQSAPLSELIVETNINSNNLYAEALLKALAVKKPVEKDETTVDAGLEVLKASLTQLGVDPNSYSVVDGSGLSRKDLISPQAMVQTLQGIGRSPYASVYRASLPVAGKSGTLKYRFLDTPPAGIVQAKTGTMTGVVTLSGYVNAPNYGPVVFSIMVNQSEQPIKVVRNAVDEIVVKLSQMRRC